MPQAVSFYYQGKVRTVYFSSPHAMLPVQLRNGDIYAVKWGRRQQENSEMPPGGWAKLSAIQAGKWDYYLPKPVRLPIEKFLKTDFEDHSQWYEVTRGKWIQGLLVEEAGQFRVYIVTIEPQLLEVGYDRWPRIMAG